MSASWAWRLVSRGIVHDGQRWRLEWFSTLSYIRTMWKDCRRRYNGTGLRGGRALALLCWRTPFCFRRLGGGLVVAITVAGFRGEEGRDAIFVKAGGAAATVSLVTARRITCRGMLCMRRTVAPSGWRRGDIHSSLWRFGKHYFMSVVLWRRLFAGRP